MVPPHLDKSVCGCSLETGSKIIGYYSLLTRALSIIVYYADAYANHHTANKDEAKMWGVLALIFIAMYAIASIFDILMLIGVIKRRPGLIFPWIVVQVITICFEIVAIISSLNQAGFAQKLFGSSIHIGIAIYCLLIVNSHHQNLKSGTTPPF